MVLNALKRQQLFLTLQQEVEDQSGGCGQMFQVVIVSPLFREKRLLARHRLVNDSLKDEISKVHAFSQVKFGLDYAKTTIHGLYRYRNLTHLKNGKRSNKNSRTIHIRHHINDTKFIKDQCWI